MSTPIRSNASLDSLLTSSQVKRVNQAVLHFKFCLITQLINSESEGVSVDQQAELRNSSHEHSLDFNDCATKTSKEYFMLDENWIFGAIESILKNLAAESIGSTAS